MPALRLAACAAALMACSCAGVAVRGTGHEPPLMVQAAPAQDGPVQAAERGRLIVSGTCASCHAVGPVGASPMSDATPFREIVQRYPLDQLEEGFAEGLVTAHPAMPAFVFSASEIDDLIAYLETLKDKR